MARMLQSELVLGLTENIANELFNCNGVDVITTGNHVWDQKEIYEFIKN